MNLGAPVARRIVERASKSADSKVEMCPDMRGSGAAIEQSQRGFHQLLRLAQHLISKCAPVPRHDHPQQLI